MLASCSGNLNVFVKDWLSYARAAAFWTLANLHQLLELPPYSCTFCDVVPTGIGQGRLKVLICTVDALMQDLDNDEGPLMQRELLRTIHGRAQLAKLTELDLAEAQARLRVWTSILCHKASI